MHITKIIAISASIYAAATQQAIAMESLTLRGFSAGMSVAEAKAVMPQLECTATPGSEFSDTSCKIFRFTEPVDFGGTPATWVVLHFYEDKLGTAAIRFKAHAFSSVTSALTAKFGEPTEKLENPMQNKMGAKFDNVELRWVRGTTELQAVQRSGRIDDSQVRLTTVEATREYEKRVQAKAKKNASTL